MKPATRSSGASFRNSLSSKWTVKISTSLWSPSPTLSDIIPVYAQYCRVEKFQDVLWEISVGLNVPDTPAYVKTLLSLPETASITKSDDETHANSNGGGAAVPAVNNCYCTLCHNIGASKIEWTIKSSTLRKEFFALLTKSLGIGSEEFKFYETDQNVIALCYSCTAQLQTLTSLFQQLKKVEESFKCEAGNLQASIVKAVGPPSQKSWSSLRERLITSHFKSTLATEEAPSRDSLGEMIDPRCSSASFDPIDDFAGTDNSLGAGDENEEVKFYVDLSNSDFEDSDNNGLADSKDRKRKRLERSSHRDGERRGKGGRAKHEVWVHFKEHGEGRSKTAECLKCRKPFKCPQPDRLVKHVLKCTGKRVNTKERAKRKRVSIAENPDKAEVQSDNDNKNQDQNESVAETEKLL